MADGWAQFGAALGGDSEKSYEEGRAMGAKTEEALANARRRVMENDALARGRDTLIKAGVPEAQADAAYTALAGGGKLEDPIQLMLQNQQYDFRKTAGDPNTTPGNANAALRGVASGPVEPLYDLGNHNYASKFGDTDKVTLLPGGSGGQGGGTSATMQFLHARGALDDNGLIRPGWESFAAHVLHPTTKSVVVNGVPTMISDDPEQYAPGRAAAPPPPRAFSPPAPGVAPASPAPQMPSVPQDSVVAQPLSTTASEAAAAGQIAAGKAQGEAQGKNAASLPTALNMIDTFSKDVDSFLAMPGFERIYGPIAGTDPGQMAVRLTDEGANAIAQRNKLNAESFRASISSMRGLGQLSNAEGEKVQAALTILADPHITPDKAREAAQQLKIHLAELKRVAQIEAGQGGAPASAGTAPAGPSGAVSLDEYLKSKGF